MENFPPENPKPKSSLPLALLLAFAPAGILMAVVAWISQQHGPSRSAVPMLWAASLLSVVCCLVSSAMLFNRRSVVAILFALLLLILNGLIAFFLGCCATLSLSN
ncbi:MAG: hypothetical protein U1F65_03995 [Verrucomicrobiota bacterium]